MALADDILTRYRSEGGGGGDVAAMPAEDEKTPAQIAAAKALIAAVKRGDAEAVCEAVKSIASEY